MKHIFLPLLILICGVSCQQKKTIDLLVIHGHIYTVDDSFSRVEAMAIDKGKILATGTTEELQRQFNANETLDAKDQFIYPGFIDAHAHFVGYGNSLQRVNLVDTKSWEEVVEKTKQFAAEHPGNDKWLLGRGWDQNDWTSKDFPDNQALNLAFPDRPVILTRIDGHAAIANQKALDLAGIRAGDQLTGGTIEVVNGRLTGILVDNAQDLVNAKIPAATAAEYEKALREAEASCFATGLTTIDDCGLDAGDVDAIAQLQQSGKLRMRLYVMLSDNPSNFRYLGQKGIIHTERLHVRSIKVYADGALGSRGACLLHPYSDRPEWSGFLLSPLSHFDSVAAYIAKQGWQMCTHAIGDSGNRTMLNIYAKYLEPGNDRRWRIEHAQVIDTADFSLFGQRRIIPSVQPTHATSDMYWAIDRLGTARARGAYAYRQLLEQNGWLALGTDFPVEDISPFKTFYASVVRKDAKGWPETGFQAENALSREQTLRGMTIWAAKSNFEEKEKGSLEKGKWADFVILDRDLMTIQPGDILSTKVRMTVVGGEKVYEKK